MKPIIRWTIGDVSEQGFNALNISIRNWKKLYEDQFDIFVCYNNISIKKIEHIKGVEFINQEDYKDSLIIPPLDGNPSWKLYPPRLKKECYEIFIDNDLIFSKRMPLIDDFLKDKFFFITEGLKRGFGFFDNLVKNKNNLNSGLFGLTPFYDFKKELETSIKETGFEKWNDFFDEQGCVAYTINKQNYKMISLLQIGLCNERSPGYTEGEYGTHFVRINIGNNKIYWNKFLKKQNKML